MNIIFGQVRFVYNLGLETKIAAYTGNKVNLTCIDLSNQIKQLKDFSSRFSYDILFLKTFYPSELI